MRLSYHPRCGSCLVALTVIVCSLLMVASTERPQAAKTPSSSIDPARRPDAFTGFSDISVMMQGKLKRTKGQLEDEADDSQSSNMENDILEAKAPATPVYTVSDLGPMPHMSVLSLRETMKQMSTTQTAAIGVIAIVMIVVLVICTCIGAFTIAYPDKVPFLGERRYAQPEDDEVIVPALQQRELQLDRKMQSPQPSGRLDYLQHAISPFASAVSLQRDTPQAFTTAPGRHGSTATLESEDALFPPPLCPSLVMPLCQARFGLAMFELAEVGGEGEVNVVGPSGNALLRGVVRKIGDSRTLEVSMLEANSSPRATIAPSLSAPGGQGIQALEIRGMGGFFYGTLEMRSSGTCCVVRDGMTVLKVDGESESLQLSLTSGLSGQAMASVRCSDESFAGTDHVEIVVEAGVDTVLCLAVVLAVLLLSPYVKDC